MVVKRPKVSGVKSVATFTECTILYLDMTTPLKSVVARKAGKVVLLGFSHYISNLYSMQGLLDCGNRISYTNPFYFHHKDILCLDTQ